MQGSEQNLWPLSSVLLVSGFGLLLLLERLFPLRMRKMAYLRHLIVNLAFSLFSFSFGVGVVRPTAAYVIGFTESDSFGLMHLLQLPYGVEFVLAFLLMDLSFYYWHVANHLLPFLWRFHNVHHMDPDLDVTTGFRFHFVEVFFSAGFRALQVGLIGLPLEVYLVYEVVFQSATLFHHANIRLPLRLERLLNRFIVTPRMHGIHHSVVKTETNSNFSVIFRFWDQLHRTLVVRIPQAKIKTGIAGYSAPTDQTLWQLIVTPFKRQRDYWRYPDGSLATRPKEDLHDSQQLS